MATQQTAVVPFAKNPVAAPANVAKFLEENSNIEPNRNANSLSFRGKVFRTVIDGEEKVVTKPGEDEPATSIRVVVLAHNKVRSRAYYEGDYQPGKSQPPACWSTDGLKPDADVKEPRSELCQTCKFSAKGSKITPSGAEVTACAVFKRIVVVPLEDLSFPPMVMRLAQTSMWDKNAEDQEAKGFYAWDQYLDMLRARGAKHTGTVATRVKFDPKVEYPKLLFGALRWLSDEEFAEVQPLFESDTVKELLNVQETQIAARKDDKTDDDDEEFEKPAVTAKPATAPAPAKKAAPAPAATTEDDDEEEPAPKKAKKGAAQPAAQAAPKKAAKAAADDDDEEEKPAAPAAKKNGKANGEGLGDLLEEWDD